jgi:hypothetical protein
MVKFKTKVKKGASKIIKAGANFGWKVLKAPSSLGYNIGRGKKVRK